MMTKKHFEAIAKVLRETPIFEIETDGVPVIAYPASIRYMLAVELADAFALDNPRFDKGRFLNAADPNGGKS